MKIYKANRKGLIHYILIGTVLLPIIIFLIDVDTFTENPFILLPIIAPLILVLWIYFDTSYKIESDQLIYRSGFLKGIIAINSIKEIQKGKTMWSGTKPALARHGLIIKYNTYDDVYVAPKDNTEMISDLLKVNSDIKVLE